MTVTLASVESNITTRRPTISLTITRPSGSWRTPEIAPRGSFSTAVTGPSWRTGGSDCATHSELAAAIATMDKPNDLLMSGLRWVSLDQSCRSVSDDDHVSATATVAADALAADRNHSREHHRPIPRPRGSRPNRRQI